MNYFMTSEKNFENRIKKFLKDDGCWFIKYWGGGEFTKSGIPDILACVNGFFVGIEVKSSSGTPSELQLVNLKKIDDSGGFGILLYPKDFEKFKSLVDTLDFGEYPNEYDELKERWYPKWEQLQKSQL